MSTVPSEGRLRRAALDYAGQGYRVLPCRPGEKTPLIRDWPVRATSDVDRVRAWWSRWPQGNIGILTGAPGPDVLDIDVRPTGNGLQALAYLRCEGVLDGAHREVETPSGGVHLWFPGTTQRKSKISGAFVDFQALGGYVLVPPSQVVLHGELRRYREVWARPNGGAALDWAAVRDRLGSPGGHVARARHERRTGGRRRVPGRSHPAIRRLGSAREGHRNSTLFNSACWLLREGYDPSCLVEVALARGLTAEAGQRARADCVLPDTALASVRESDRQRLLSDDRLGAATVLRVLATVRLAEQVAVAPEVLLVDIDRAGLRRFRVLVNDPEGLRAGCCGLRVLVDDPEGVPSGSFLLHGLPPS